MAQKHYYYSGKRESNILESLMGRDEKEWGRGSIVNKPVGLEKRVHITNS